MDTTVETFDYHTYTGGFGIIPILVILALIVVPYWQIWSRSGHSGAWALLMLLPVVNVISLWVLAFKKWPALSGREGR